MSTSNLDLLKATFDLLEVKYVERTDGDFQYLFLPTGRKSSMFLETADYENMSVERLLGSDAHYFEFEDGALISH